MKNLLIISFTFIAVGFLFYVFYTQVVSPLMFPGMTPPQLNPLSSPTPTVYSENHARFLIFTNDTKRIFTDTKYHHRSNDVFITASDPTVVVVRKEGVTWQQFFDSLPSPMKVSEDCLTTGTGQQFCNTASASLHFYLNGAETQHILQREIKNGDSLLIDYGNKNMIEQHLQELERR